MKYYLYGEIGLNDEVINHYLNIICRSIECETGKKVERIINNNIEKEDIVIFYSIKDVLNFKKRCNYYLWVQGVVPEERRMRGKSVFDFFAISILEKHILNNAQKLFFVSNGMLKHYQEKYGKDFSKKVYIMPCYNERIRKEEFYVEKKYDTPTFCYVGSLSEWQCFEETVFIYKTLEEEIGNTHFYVFTREIEKANSILKKHSAKHYTVESVKPELLHERLKTVKYGFILRNQSPVNRVATPTKLGNYIASGVMPVLTDKVDYFKELSEKYNYIILGKTDEDIIKKILKMESQGILKSDVYHEYKKIFDKEYNDDLHINEIRQFITHI